MNENNYKVLVVDDEPELLEILCEYLEERGFKVQSAENGMKAWELVEKNTFDVVLSDLKMPGGDGFELLKKIRKKYPDKPLVFLLSGFSDISVESAFNEGANALILKPYGLEELTQKILQKLSLPKESWTRKEPRIVVTKTLNFCSKNMDGVLNGKVLNLGRGGAFIHCQQSELPESPGSIIEFNLKFEEGPVSLLSITGIVRWIRSTPSNNEPIGFGLEFIDLNKESLDFILDLIKQLAKSPAVIPIR